MTKKQYQTCLLRLRLDNHQTAGLLGVSFKTTQAWHQGVTKVPEPVSRLLTVIEVIGLSAYDILMQQHRDRHRKCLQRR